MEKEGRSEQDNQIMKTKIDEEKYEEQRKRLAHTLGNQSIVISVLNKIEKLIISIKGVMARKNRSTLIVLTVLYLIISIITVPVISHKLLLVNSDDGIGFGQRGFSIIQLPDETFILAGEHRSGKIILFRIQEDLQDEYFWSKTIDHINYFYNQPKIRLTSNETFLLTYYIDNHSYEYLGFNHYNFDGELLFNNTIEIDTHSFFQTDRDSFYIFQINESSFLPIVLSEYSLKNGSLLEKNQITPSIWYSNLYNWEEEVDQYTMMVSTDSYTILDQISKDILLITWDTYGGVGYKPLPSYLIYGGLNITSGLFEWNETIETNKEAITSYKIGNEYFIVLEEKEIIAHQVASTSIIKLDPINRNHSLLFTYPNMYNYDLWWRDPITIKYVSESGIVIQETLSNPDRYYNVYKVDWKEGLQWNTTKIKAKLRSYANSDINDIIETDTDIILVGWSYNIDHHNDDIWIIKYSKTGELIDTYNFSDVTWLDYLPYNLLVIVAETTLFLLIFNKIKNLKSKSSKK